MALKKISGPFEMKDLYGNYREAGIHFWCDELDGFLASGSWHPNPSAVELEYGLGILQLDGTFTPRRSRPYGTDFTPYYDLAKRRLAAYTGEPPDYNFARDVDWHSLEPPYAPENIPLNVASDGVHEVSPHIRMFLPDRMIFLGKTIEPPFYVGNGTTKIFSLAYGADSPPVAEHTIQTSVVPGSGVWEDWRPTANAATLMQSSTPDRTVFLVWSKGTETRAVEYDYVAKTTLGWVRRLGFQAELSYELAIGGQTYPRLVGYSVKHKFWLVQDTPSISPTDFHLRISIFADEAAPMTLSNPVALSPTRTGEAVRYRVRLTGADGDPCIGHRVNWTCSNVGTVGIPQSVTDDGGYAETMVSFPPRADGAWEGTTITAEVVY
jgi:hypothetical protein